MLSVSEIALLPPSLAAGQPVPRDAAAVAHEFDAMVVQVLLQQGGLLRAFGSEESPEAGLLGEMLLPTLARELTAQLGAGFGNLWLQQAQTFEGETAK